MGEEAGRYRAPALDKGLDILELLAEHAAGLTQADIAKALGRSPSELYRMLDTLVRRGYVRRSLRDDRLMLGVKLFALATHHPPMRRLLQVAAEVSAAVAEETLQSCHLTLYRDGNLVVAVQTDSPGRMGLGLRVGASLDLLTTGSGQVMLSFQSAARRERMLAAHAALMGEEADGEAVDRLVAATRKRGHARKKSGQIFGVEDLAFPILGRTGDAVAVLAIPYIRRLDLPEAPSIERAREVLAAAARDLSAELPAGVADHVEPPEFAVSDDLCEAPSASAFPGRSPLQPMMKDAR
ncbi:IclR family transcriptional regulator [Acuticoccus kandeliae]|uniref:IclR family transcriptional regulator n=1 Tax=Acuticoccus kandeliae TaxID=2073160 RepID=UPI000D3E48AD|nr:IclR family transcriptional regulator [Acuticoccus kandeliae]